MGALRGPVGGGTGGYGGTGGAARGVGSLVARWGNPGGEQPWQLQNAGQLHTTCGDTCPLFIGKRPAVVAPAQASTLNPGPRITVVTPRNSGEHPLHATPTMVGAPRYERGGSLGTDQERVPP